MTSQGIGQDVRPGLDPHGFAGAAAALAEAPEAGAFDEHEHETVSEPVTLAESLITGAGWSPSNFGGDGLNPPYLRIGGKLRVTLTEFEPCFSSFRRDRVLFRSKVSIADHLSRYDQIMVDPLAFEDCFGPEEGTDATFPFGAWLAIREVRFTGIELWGRHHGRVVLPLEPLAVASAVWLRNAVARPPALL